MRALILRDGLVDPSLPERLPGTVTGKSVLTLNGVPVELVELDVADADGLAVAGLVAGHLLPTRFYAHLLSGDRMIVAFPKTVSLIRRGEPESAALARRVGALFDIPDGQMRFEEMFDVDHPDGADA